MFNFNHLYYFYITAREGRVVKAAAILKISQPALSSQLKALERETGKSLFTKVGRKLELSADGQSTYALCKQMFEISNRLSLNFQLSPDQDRTKLQVAVGDEIERPFAASYLSKLLQSLDTEAMSIRMVSNRHAILIDELDKNRFDLLISNYTADEREFETLSQAKVPVYAFCSTRRPDLPKQELSAKRLVEFLKRRKPHLVQPTQDQKLRHEIDHFLEQNSISLPLMFESNVLAAVIRSTVEDLGISFLPLIYIDRELKLKQLHRLSAKPLWHHSLSLICKHSLQTDPLIQKAKTTFDKMTSELR
jgi:LysR family transcriptional activator of nhaA